MPNPEVFNSIDLTGVKGVLLDIDDTLYPYADAHKPAQAAMIELLATQLGLTVVATEEYYKKARLLQHHRLHGQAASHSRLLYAQTVTELALNRTDVALTFKAEELYWNTFLRLAKPFSQAIDFLNRCKELEIPVCLVTDLTTQIQLRKIITFNFSDKIQYMVSSEEVGHEKPHPSMFLTALNKLGIKANEAIMIGDSQEKDIQGAEALAIKAIKI